MSFIDPQKYIKEICSFPTSRRSDQSQMLRRGLKTANGMLSDTPLSPQASSKNGRYRVVRALND